MGSYEATVKQRAGKMPKNAPVIGPGVCAAKGARSIGIRLAILVDVQRQVQRVYGRIWSGV
jgi:hypothetical protein